MRLANNQQVQAIILEMTLDEKLAQLGSHWIYELQTEGELDHSKFAAKLGHGIGQITRLGGASSYSPREAARAANILQKYLVQETRLGIPAILHEECCCGAMIMGGTVFPQMLGLAATFQPELACEMTKVIRSQLRAVGARQGLGPVLDVARDPRWGRVEETFGEDPTLTSQFGTAYIQGLQGTDLFDGVLATGKHFIGHSFSQGGLNCGPVHMGWREIYDVCFAPFQAAFRMADLGSVMNSYPDLDGEVVAASKRILTEILRNELGFDGLLVSDYQAVNMLHNFHFVAEDPAEAACLALNAGIDVELPTASCYADPLRAALENGDICMETIDQAVSRHIMKKQELGLFDNPFVDEEGVIEVFNAQKHRSLAKEIAMQSMVLLKNDGLLPLKKSTRVIAVIGPNAHDARNLLGDYAYGSMIELLEYNHELQKPVSDLGRSPSGKRMQTVLEGIQAKAEADTNVLYSKGCDIRGEDVSGFEAAVRVAKQADVVVLVLGDRSGLVPDCTTGETRDAAHLKLPGVQEELAKAVVAAGKPVVAVLVNGRPYAIPWIDENCQAIIEAWLPGQEGAAAIADVLFGEANPGGKLPITFPRGVGQVPIYYSASPSGKSSFWYTDYANEQVKPLYPFGFGLSFTSFVYENLFVDKEAAGSGEVVNISLWVSNSGSISGDEVVQLYIRDDVGSVPRPSKELKGFARIKLQPGETRQVTFHLQVDQLAFYNNDLDLVVEAGAITVMVGSSSEDIRLRGGFNATGPRQTVIKERVFLCPVSIS